MRYHSKQFEHITKLLPSLYEPATYMTSDALTIIAGVPGESTAELEKVTIKGIEFAECSDHEASEGDSKENLYFALVQLCADLSVTAIASDAAEDVALAEWFGYTIEECEKLAEGRPLSTLQLSMKMDCLLVLMPNYSAALNFCVFDNTSIDGRMVEWVAVAGESGLSDWMIFPWFKGNIHNDPAILAARQRLKDSE